MRGSRNLSNRCSILAILCALASLLAPDIASVSTVAGAETRVWAFGFQDPACVGVKRSRTLQLCPGCELAYDELASDFPLAARGGGGPAVRSVYSDGTRVLQGQQPARVRGPDPSAQGPHTVLRRDTVNNRVYQGREFDAAGNTVRDVDFTNSTFPNGTPRRGHPGPPHQHRFDVNDPRVGSSSGHRRGGPEAL